MNSHMRYRISHDKDADALNEMDQKVAAGTYSSSPRRYTSDAQRIATSSLEEHRALGRGEVKKYEKYSKELVNATGNPAFLQMYKKDVKNH